MLTKARLLPFVDVFALFEQSYDTSLKLKAYTNALFTGLGLTILPSKGHIIHILVGEHMDMIIDTKVEKFVAPSAKLKSIVILAINFAL